MNIKHHKNGKLNVTFIAIMVISIFAIFAIRCASDNHKSAITEGEVWFKSYCAPCHGEQGDGKSQVGYTMDSPPKNLRQIAKRRNGMFPDAEISKIIAGVENVPGHSTNVMPAWWEAFKKAEGITDEKVLQQKIDNITAYLKTIQE